MCLRFVFLLITRVAAWLQLSRREETWKTAEILILRHQLTVLQRRQPRRTKLNWADRALLAILLGVIPKARRHGLRLLVTPDTIMHWHRGIIRRRWAAGSVRGKTGRPPAGTSRPWCSGWPGRIPNGLSQDPRRARKPGSEGSGVDGVGDSEEGRNRPRPAPTWAFMVAVAVLRWLIAAGGRLMWWRRRAHHLCSLVSGSHGR